MRVLGIDQGTTSTRALTITEDNKLEVIHAVAHAQNFPRQGWVEQDPEELLRNIKTCVAAAGELDVIGIDNQGESCLAWHATTKEALSPVIGWQDSRTQAVLEKMRADGLETQTLAKAGLPIDPYFSASKLGWIVKNLAPARDALKQGELRLGTTDAFFLDRLAGKCVTDVTTASRTSLMALDKLKWDEELCDLFGVPIECLPEITATTGDFGAMETGFGPVPVTASIVDQQAALYGFGCREKGDAKITFGTGAFALAVTGDEIINKPELGLLPTVAWQFEGQDPVYALDGGVFTASSAINWAQSLGLFKDHAELNAFQNPAAIQSGLIFVPALAGLGCPHWQPNARGIWLGLSLGHGPEQLTQSILEGIAFRATEVVQAMDRCVPLKDAIFIDGGMSKNPYFNQFLADVCGRQVRPAAVPELTGLGTVMLACQATGETPGFRPEFGSYLPAANRDDDFAKFKKAVSMASDWPAL